MSTGLWWSDTNVIKGTKELGMPKLEDINWLDEVPMGVEGQAPYSPDAIDQLPDQARIWATIRNAVVQAYAEGYNTAMADAKEKDLPF